jgi:nucleotide-binding universal stress UspA family protein
MARVFAAQVTLLHVLEPQPSGDEARVVDPLGWRMKQLIAQTYLDELTGKLQKLDLAAENVLLTGNPAARIVDFVAQAGVDLVALSSHGQGGLSRWNVSAVAQKLIMQVGTSILLARAQLSGDEGWAAVHYPDILLPLDGSLRAEYALPVVDRLANHEEARVRLVYVISRPRLPRRVPLSGEDAELYQRVTERNRQAATRYLEQVQAQLSVESETLLLDSDDVTEALHDAADAEGIDLLVLSAHSFSESLQRPYGSLATSLIAYSAIPLLVVQDLPADQIRLTQVEIAAAERTERG